MKKVILFICLIVLLSVGLLKSYVEVTPVSTVNFKTNESLIYAVDSLPNSISPSEFVSRGEEDLTCSIFSGLIELNEKGEPIPDLAMGWKVSEDGLEYTFKINEENKWSNGKEIVAKDFQIFFRELLSPDNEEYSSDELDSIYGVKEYREGKSDFSKVAINSPDDYTLTIRMNNKDDQLLKKLSKPIYRLRDLNEPLDNYKKDFNQVSYTGPYTIYDITDNGFIHLKDNPYNKSQLEIKDVVLKEKEADEVELAAFNLNKVDILKNPPIIYSDDLGLYKDLSKFNNETLKVMLVNSENPELSQGISSIMNVLINESNILKNNLGEPYVNLIDNKEKLSLKNKQSSELNHKISDGEKNNYREIAKSKLKKCIDENEVLKIIIEDKEEDKILANELKSFLEKELSIKSIIKVHEEGIDEVIKKGDFNIALVELNLNKDEELLEESKEEISDLENEEKDSVDSNTEENLENKEKEMFLKEENLSLISLYFKNDVWCKSQKVNYLFIDGNGNLIFKYSS
ncbi:ABC transporter substrate-binding protein [Clostridium sp. LIBA-8841]|uniref:ABC transporter substrate-binding protein n=1 Tax=Clostridium sp. LIBA-8841 TaxID=2987530 RepID=UPI002AC6EED9|nr:ABC transporter substrate-binding protein [Clostridium sp. LIBA-8841]MDZ5255093.1 ABC transporter substrate-binding protein [Clostridium sp. LIBA-8841]